MQDLLGEVRLALRLIAKNPGFYAIAIVALALGIGANTAVFTAVDAVLIRPLPYHDPDRLVMVWEDASYIGFARNTPAPANYVDWRAQNTVFEDIAALRYRGYTITGDGPAEELLGRGVTANFWPLLGVQPMLGRTFSDEEDRSRARVVVLSYNLWQRRFGADQRIIGRDIVLNGQNTTVIGVMPRGFHFPTSTTDFWVPANFSSQDLANRGSHFLNVVARLKAGVSLKQAQTEMAEIAKRLEQQYPATNRQVGATLVPLKDQVVGVQSTALYVLLGAAACVLLIACSNIANLLLARAAVRHNEMSIRVAIGASQGRLLRQMIVEGLVLSLLAAALGIGVAYAGLGLLKGYLPAGVATTELSLDLRVLAFCLAVAVIAGMLFSLAPSFSTLRQNVQEGLRQGGRGNAGSQGRLRPALVVTATALSIILLVGAGLMVQTLMRIRSTDLGFRTTQILTLRTALPLRVYDTDAKLRTFYDTALARIKALPGVESAAFSSNLPFTARGNTNGFRLEGQPADAPIHRQDALYREVTADYFQTIGARLKEGRFFTSSDQAESQPVIVINDLFAERAWPGESAIGKRILTQNTTWTVVGVIADMKERGIDLEPKMAYYFPTAQVGRPTAFWLAVKTKGDPAAIAKSVQSAIWEIDRQLPIAAVRPMDALVELDFANRQQQMFLLGAFSALALLEAALGIYGVLAYMVAQRRREIGLRMALGATSGNVVQTVLRHGFVLAGLGIVIGTGIALALSRVMQSLLYQTAPNDPATYAGVVTLVALVSLAACAIPSLRAARVDPMKALRDE